MHFKPMPSQCVERRLQLGGGLHSSCTTVPVPQFLRSVGQTLNERPSTSQHDSANRQQAFAGSSLLSSFYSFFFPTERFHSRMVAWLARTFWKFENLSGSAGDCERSNRFTDQRTNSRKWLDKNKFGLKFVLVLGDLRE